MSVRAIPLADRGFVPVGDLNPVRWYLEDCATGALVSGSWSFRERIDAERWAERQGWRVEP